MDALGSSGRRGRTLSLWIFIALIAAAWFVARPGVEAQTPPDPVATEPQPSAAVAPASDPAEFGSDDPRGYGLWVLVPAVAAIGLTILTRQVVASLFVGLILGAFMYALCLPQGAPFAGHNFFVACIRLTMEKYIVGSIHETPEQNYARIKVLIFTFLVSFMVGVIGRNGGTAGMVRIVAGQSASPRRGALTAWLAGMMVFFDDYASCMIIGPTMRPVFDRLKRSRAMLAYIVDATASPVASLAIIGTWIGAVLGYISSGLDPVLKAGAPGFLLDAQGNAVTAMQAFIYSLPYRFYPILAIVCAFVVALLGRNFGPMRTSENRALSRRDLDASAPEAGPQPAAPTWWLGFFPVAALVLTTLVILAVTGLAHPQTQAMLGQTDLAWWEKGARIIGAADSYLSILYGSLAAAVSAILLTIIARTCRLADAMDAGLASMAHTVPALAILVLAWGLSQVEQDLMLGEVLTAKMQAMNFPATWLPLAIVIVASLISFCTGTSWGTMGILCPIAIPLAVKLCADLPPEQALTIFYASVGSVLGGAIFGDHCSPISSTTVLSAIGSDCPLVEHVWTQMPYALVTVVVAIGVGEVGCVVYGQPWYYALAAGSAAIFLVVLIFGRRPKTSFDLIEA